MIKQFLKDSVIYGIGQVLTYGITFFLIPFYTQVFTTRDYGVVDLILIFQRFALLVVAMEILQGATRFAIESEKHKDRRAFVSTGFWFSITSYTIFVVVIWLLPESVSYWFLNVDDHQTLIRIGAFAIWGQGLYIFALTQLRFQFKALQYAVVSILYTILYVGSVVFLVQAFGNDPRGVFVGQFIAATSMALCAIYLGRADYSLQFDLPKFKKALGFSYPLVFSGIGVVVYIYIDRLVINEILGLGQVGVYAVGAQIATGMRLLIVGFQLSLTPLVYTYYKQSETPKKLETLFRYFTVLGLVAIASISMFSREIIQLIATPDFYEAWTVIPMLISSTLLANMYIFTPGLVIHIKTKRVAVISIVGGVINLLLNLVLIPIFNIQGAALATLLSSAIVFGMYIYQNQKLYRIPFQWTPIVLATITTVLTISVGLQVTLDIVPSIITRILLCVLLVLVMFLSGMIKISDAVQIYHMIVLRQK